MWIELHDSILDHPKLLKLARDLGLSRVVTLGHVTSLWLWALRLAPDGNLSSFDSEDIELGAGWDGERGALVSAMVSRRLIDFDGSAYHIHDWQDYATHLKAADRKRKEREAKKAREELLANRSQDVTGRHVTSCDGDRKSGPVTLTGRPTDQTDQTDRPDRSQDTTTCACVRPAQITNPKLGVTKQIAEVFDAWRSHHPDQHLTPHTGLNEWREIEKRLTCDGCTVEVLLEAIEGIHLDDWVDRPRNTTLWHVVRDLSSVQRFQAIAREKQGGSKSPAWQPFPEDE